MPHQLDIKVAHVKESPGSFPDHSKGLWQDSIHVLAASKHVLEFRCFSSQRFV